LRAEVEAAEAELQGEKIALAEERRAFAHGSQQTVKESAAACRELLALHKDAATVINEKKLDLLKIKVHEASPFLSSGL